jgi:hypothetical protein
VGELGEHLWLWCGPSPLAGHLHARCLTFSPPGAHVLLGPFKRPGLLGARAGKKGCQQPPCGAGVHCRAVAELDAVCSGFKCGRLGWDDHQSPPSPSSTDRGLATIATATSFAAPLVSAPDLTLPRAPPGSPPSPPHARWRQHRRLRCHYPHHCRISPYAALTFARRPSPLPALPVPALSVANLAAALLAALADADLVTLALPNAIH